MRTNTGQVIYIPRIGQRANFKHPLMKGCVGWWPLTDGGGGIVKDLVRGNNGIQSGGVTWADTKKGRAASFDGADDYISIADTDDLSFGDGSTDSAFSVSAWIYLNNFTNSNGIVGKYDDASPFLGEWSMYTNQTSGTLGFQCNDASPIVRVRRDTDNALTLNEWLHVAAVYNGGGTDGSITMYVNGTLVNSTGAAQDASYIAMANTASSVTIGSILNYHGVGSYKLDGNIQNVRIWDRALSSSEVFELYINPWSGLSMPSETRYFFLSSPSPTINPFSRIITSSTILNKSGKTVIRRGV